MKPPRKIKVGTRWYSLEVAEMLLEKQFSVPREPQRHYIKYLERKAPAK